MLGKTLKLLPPLAAILALSPRLAAQAVSGLRMAEVSGEPGGVVEVGVRASFHGVGRNRSAPPVLASGEIRPRLRLALGAWSIRP